MQKKRVMIIVLTFLVCFACNSCSTHDDSNNDFFRTEIHLGCAEIQPDGTPKWECSYQTGYIDPSWDEKFLKLLHGLKTRPSAVLPTDVELIEVFSCEPETNEHILYLAYDYSLKKVYVNKDGLWHETTIPKQLTVLLSQAVDSALFPLAEKWKVQSRFCTELFDERDLDNLVFRYNVYWKPNSKLTAEQDDYKNSNFNNTTTVTIETPEQAIERASQEMGYSDPIGVAFYDKTCQYWMVELYDKNAYGLIRQEFVDRNDYADEANRYLDFLFEKGYTVIMDHKGRTVETYQSITDGRLFIDIVFKDRVIGSTK